MKYYKIINKEENHSGLQYHTGLNVDPKPFNPSGDCEKGGIYFASTDILAFLSYGPWIREVALPEGEVIYENPGEPKKYKAHRVILGERREITLDVIKELVEEGANPRTYNDYALQLFARNGHIETVKYLVSLGCDPRARTNYAIRLAAAGGHLEIVKYLIALMSNLKYDNDSAFTVQALNWAIENGHLETVKYLVSLGCDPRAGNDYALRYADNHGHTDVVEYLKSL